MSNSSKQQQPWVGLSQLNEPEAFRRHSELEMPSHSLADQVEKADTVELKSNRRDFLKMMGFGVGAATVAAACDIPRHYAVPYVIKPGEIVPGVATYYASSYVSGNDYCPVLVKTREGRPIKIEGNTINQKLGNGTTSRAQASVLSLYDTNRLQGPSRVTRATEGVAAGAGERLGWGEIDNLMEQALTPSARVRIVTNTVHSPSLRAAIEQFRAAYPQTQVVTYDTSTSSALVQSTDESFGVRAVPGYKFDQADVIVGLECDFLGTWVFPSLYNDQYARRRRIVNQVQPTMSRHYQIESTMSLTGSNADHRARVKPSHLGQATLALYNEVTGSSAGSAQLDADASRIIKQAAADLKAARGRALVVSGSNNLAEQRLVAAINNALGAYGTTIDVEQPTLLRQGIDRDIQTLVGEMSAGRVDVVLFHGDVNPAYDLPNRNEFRDALAKVKYKVSLAGSLNETGALCDITAPDHHGLESWGDAEPLAGLYTIVQPTITPIWETRQAGESLLRWAKSPALPLTREQPYMEFMRDQWQTLGFARQNQFASFDTFWDSFLSDGVFEASRPVDTAPAATGSFSSSTAGIRKPAGGDGLEIVITEPVGIGMGTHANNPWLQEVPDPVTRTTWGNYLQIPVGYSGGNNYTTLGDLNQEELKGKTDETELTVGGLPLNLFCVVQFGMAPSTVAIAAGYGRTVVGKAGLNVGVDIVPWTQIDGDGNRQYYATDVVLGEKQSTDPRFAIVQYHNTMGVTGMDGDEAIVVDEERTLFGGYGGVFSGYKGSLTERSIINRANLDDLEGFTEGLREKREEFATLNSHSLYEGYEDAYDMGQHWGMYVDLNTCTGCSACVVACISENNTPVVGKSEVARHHEMTWLRIDRYYYGDVDNPQVVYQPMMCQQCDNAPCENVCPVAAVNHSSEGLNQMIYNRCIGTRYCANNCPYKVRRFNWMDYTTADLFIGNEPDLDGDAVVPLGGGIPFGADNLTRMVLNPDVTVRSRGVMEKCSFCVQRIQAGKLTAKRESRRLVDSDVRTACQTACPTGAITFGDRNNPQGELMKVWNAPINYLVLEEVNVAPSVMYSSKISNRSAALASPEGLGDPYRISQES